MGLEEKISKNIKWILLGIFILALVLRLIFISSSPIRWWDEAVYANIGYDLSKNPFDYSLKNASWGDYIPDDSWPHLGFRPPLLPYMISILYFFKLDFLINFLMPIIGALSVIVLYFLAKKLFNTKIALLSSLFFALLPIQVFYSSRIMNDVLATFFILITFYCFWKGFEETNNKYKVLFGIFFALSLLSKYTALWLIPVFLLYFIIRDKSFKFLADRFFWYSVLSFFIILIPWLIYGFFEYGNIFGAFLHGFISAPYWGGIQDWYFFFQYFWRIFSVLGIVFIGSLIYAVYKKDYSRQNILILIWIFVFLAAASFMPHKEERFILPLIPGLIVLSAYGLTKIKKYFKIFGIIILILLCFSLLHNFQYYYSKSHNIDSECFLETLNYLDSLNSSYKTYSDNSPIFFYYTRKPSGFFLSLNDSYLDEISNYPEYEVYFVFNNPGSGVVYQEYPDFRYKLSGNYDLVYSCNLNPYMNFIYKA